MIELIGFISIVGSLLFVGFEMHQAQQISSSEQDLTRAEITMDLRANQNEHIEIWQQGNAGQPLDEPSSMIYRNLLLDAWDRAEALSQARSRIGSDANLAIHQFAAFLFNNPGARATWTKEIESQTADRNLLGYDIPGYDLRRKIVFEDLKIMAQPIGSIKPNTESIISEQPSISQQVEPTVIKENQSNN